MTEMFKNQDTYKFMNLIPYEEENRNCRQTMTSVQQCLEEEFYTRPQYGRFDSNNIQEALSCGENSDILTYVDQSSPHGGCLFSPRAADVTWPSEISQPYDIELRHFGNPCEIGTRYDHKYYSGSTVSYPGTSHGSFDRTFHYDDLPYTHGSGDDSNGSVEYDPVVQPNHTYKFNNASQNLLPHFETLPHFDTFLCQSRTKHRQRGRPPTFYRPGYSYSEPESLTSDDDDRMSVTQPVSKCRRGAKNILLWKFLLEELRKPQSHIKWENESEGTFKFVDTAECSRLWGLMKKKEDMNFEKLSRGIRHYYKDDLMSRKNGVRLVYKFNWNRVPKKFCPVF